MNKFQLLKAQQAAFNAAEKRSVAVADGLTAQLAYRDAHAISPTPTLTGQGKFEALKKQSSTALGLEIQNLPYVEIDRIVEMPVIVPMNDDECFAYCQENVLADALAKGWKLFNLQAESLLAYDTFGGLFAEIGVGWG